MDLPLHIVLNLLDTYVCKLRVYECHLFLINSNMLLQYHVITRSEINSNNLSYYQNYGFYSLTFQLASKPKYT